MLTGSWVIQTFPNTPLAGLGFHHPASGESADDLVLSGYTVKYCKFLADTYQKYYEIQEAKDEDIDY